MDHPVELESPKERPKDLKVKLVLVTRDLESTKEYFRSQRKEYTVYKTLLLLTAAALTVTTVYVINDRNIKLDRSAEGLVGIVALQIAGVILGWCWRKVNLALSGFGMFLAIGVNAYFIAFPHYRLIWNELHGRTGNLTVNLGSSGMQQML